jgi:hypothetical protein
MTYYYKEYDMVTWNDLELRNKPVRTRFVHKKHGQNRETYILEWSVTRELVKLSDGEWYKVSDVVVLDYLNGPHVDCFPYWITPVYDRFVTTPWIPYDTINQQDRRSKL